MANSYGNLGGGNPDREPSEGHKQLNDVLRKGFQSKRIVVEPEQSGLIADEGPMYTKDASGSRVRVPDEMAKKLREKRDAKN